MGFEPTTFCMASRRSSQLSYSRANGQYSRVPGSLPSRERTRDGRPPDPRGAVGLDRAKPAGDQKRTVSGPAGGPASPARGPMQALAPGTRRYA